MNVNLVMRLMKYSYINGRVVFLFGFFLFFPSSCFVFCFDTNNLLKEPYNVWYAYIQ